VRSKHILGTKLTAAMLFFVGTVEHGLTAHSPLPSPAVTHVT